MRFDRGYRKAYDFYMKHIINFVLFIWTCIKACIYECAVYLKIIVSHRAQVCQVSSGARIGERQEDCANSTVSNAVGRYRLNVSSTTAVSKTRFRQSARFSKSAMARPKNPQKSLSLSEDTDKLFEMQREHSTKAFDCISKALHLDESTTGFHIK